MNTVGSILDAVERRYLQEADRLPTNLLLTATRPSTQGLVVKVNKRP